MEINTKFLSASVSTSPLTTDSKIQGHSFICLPQSLHTWDDSQHKHGSYILFNQSSLLQVLSVKYIYILDIKN